ncbi:MAG TPA: molybdenum cofactor sulfurase [Rhizobiaceae bacterium]|nr:molybdenum cofactor sulfurase [Rhizobiaceae bacterium]
MNDPLARRDVEPEIRPSFKLVGRVEGVYRADGKDFVTRAVSHLDCGFDGIAGDLHSGLTRKAGAREPWYPRGMEMRNERQITLLTPDELAFSAAAMGIAEIRPEWIGGNLLIGGIARLSMLPRGTLLFFSGGVTLKVDDQNGPCRYSGAAIARHVGRADDAALALAFVPAAKRRRGLLAWVEKPGRIEAGEAVRAQIPEQWIYTRE